ncbi:hypothetical protein FSP39_022493 [Pinctada imbricata]|uniref:B box-type domain-containing protein n=1 Tax=Pinctada imbricata TaxID=66713 RepID=A0AA88YI46_PINIB|nr:hypothetical protein FSP39_022493 [Pinctada imbricata]
MAFASSRLGAQEAFIKPCDLCEDDEDVNWFCKDCVQNLCDRCKKIHLKTIACKNHHIVSILEGVAIAKKNVSNLCQDHDELFTYFCRTCDKNICSMCLSLIHRKHDFVDLRILQSELQGILDDILREKREEKIQIVKNVDSLDECAKTCKSTLSERCNLIDDRVEAIKKAADEEGHKLKLSLESTADGTMKEVDERKQKLEGRKNVYEGEIELVQQELKLQTASTLNDYVKKSVSKLQSLKPLACPIPRNSTFITGKINRELIRDMIGKEGNMPELSDDCGSSESIKPSDDVKGENGILSELKILKIHNLKGESIERDCFCICESPCGNFLIGSTFYICKVTPDFAKVLIQISTMSTCLKIACLFSSDIVVCYERGTSYLEIFNSDGRKAQSINLSPMYAYDIAVTNHDEFAVSSNNGSYLSKSSLFMFTTKGKVKDSKTDIAMGGLCMDKTGTKFWTSDKKSPYLISLDRNGDVLRKIQISKSYLQKMTIDRHGNILGVPSNSNPFCTIQKEIYLISDDGEVERTYLVECDKKINDICIDSKNRLLILVDNGKIIVADYLQ